MPLSIISIIYERVLCAHAVLIIYIYPCDELTNLFKALYACVKIMYINLRRCFNTGCDLRVK